MNHKTGLYLTYALYLFVITSLLILSLFPHIAVAEAVPNFVTDIEPIKYQEGEKVPQEEIDKIISQYATGDKAYQIKRTIWCESHNWNVQSQIIDRTGNRELSYGLGQIHLPSHPSITKEQALDPEFSIKWMAANFENTKWYGYSRELDKCNN